jgi:flagellar protein FliO/FliZ
MRAKIIISGLLLSRLAICDALAAADVPTQIFENLIAEDITLWSVSLLAILGALSLGFWGFRKFNGINASAKDKMRVAGGLSLGMWEKVVLLQVGNKQLILGVTPGRIQTLHVLEENECLIKAEKVTKIVKDAVAQKLRAEIPTLTEANPLTLNGRGVSSDRFSYTEPKTVNQEPASDKGEPSRLSMTQSYEKHLEYVQSLVDQNPKLTAQTLKAWIRDE